MSKDNDHLVVKLPFASNSRCTGHITDHMLRFNIFVNFPFDFHTQIRVNFKIKDLILPQIIAQVPQLRHVITTFSQQAVCHFLADPHCGNICALFTICTKHDPNRIARRKGITLFQSFFVIGDDQNTGFGYISQFISSFFRKNE